MIAAEGQMIGIDIRREFLTQLRTGTARILADVDQCLHQQSFIAIRSIRSELRFAPSQNVAKIMLGRMGECKNKMLHRLLHP